MSDNLNKVTLIGNVGDDPKYINFDGGRKKFASFSLATSRNWFDAGTNERKSKTEWHRIVVYNENLVAIMERKNVQKSSKLYLEGSLTNRKWIDQKGNNRVTTEIVLQGFSCNLLILSSLNMNRNEDGEVGHLDGAETNQNNNNYEKKLVYVKKTILYICGVDNYVIIKKIHTKTLNFFFNYLNFLCYET